MAAAMAAVVAACCDVSRSCRRSISSSGLAMAVAVSAAMSVTVCFRRGGGDGRGDGGGRFRRGDGDELRGSGASAELFGVLRLALEVFNVKAWRELTELHRALSIIQLGQVFFSLARTELTEPHPVLSIIQFGGAISWNPKYGSGRGSGGGGDGRV